ncbi:MAG: FAD-binding oxidoreductase [Candidatus Rokubacteria bacterium]|nr:FAD-binding oxidoreductase [Candidatus Rokubacteria bacterium]
MPSTLVEKLAAVVGPDHVATGVALSPYVIEGRTPEAAVFPGTVDDVRAVLGVAAALAVPVVPWGGGTAAGVGMPTTWSGLVLGLGRLNRILEHEPGDLTVTAEAGVTIAQLQAALGAKGQWLSLDPPDADRATVGGVIAANASGPRRHLYGTARDLLIGVSVVTAEGEVVRGGGKVVKNVAGYDLPKLYIGSYGTLGIVVEATFKLRPRPDDERFVPVMLSSVKDAGAALRSVMGSDLVPTVLELLDADAARALGVTAAAALVVGFDGLTEQIDWQATELARIAAAHGGRTGAALGGGATARLATAARDACPAAASVMRLSVLPTQVAETIEHGGAAAKARGLTSAWSAHAGVGVVTAVLAAPDVARATDIAAVLGEWRGVARAGGGFATLEWAPLAVKASVPVWDDLGAAGRVMQRIKAELDPNNLLNPGRFVGGM